jgi:gliding motility-associated-like protein
MLNFFKQTNMKTILYHLQIITTMLVISTATSSAQLTFQVSSQNPSYCNATDGIIYLTGLSANQAYSLTYSKNGSIVGPISIVSDATGKFSITNLSSGAYTNFNIINPAGVNLVPNPSFETVDCQTSLSFPWGCSVTNNPSWLQPTLGSSDSFNGCHTGNFGNFSVPTNFQGSQNARTGNGYAGLITFELSSSVATEYREYIEAQLTSPLIAGTTYLIGFYCSLAEESTLASNRLGMHLSTSPLNDPSSQTAINVTPQLVSTTIINDTTNWVFVSTSYTAVGGEEYVTIGNFSTDANTLTSPKGSGGYTRAAYYIEDVIVSAPSQFTNTTSLVLVDPPISVNAGPDISICKGKTVSLTATVPPNLTFTWDNNVLDGVPFNPPIGTTLYTVTASGNGCSGTDNVAVTVFNVEFVTFAASPSTVTNLSPLVSFNNTSIGSVFNAWNFGDGTNSTLPSPSHKFPTGLSATYTVTLMGIDANGCIDTATTQVIVKDEFFYYVPAAFTPDGDELNQTFHPVFNPGFDSYDFNFTIFNRWGETLFESKDASVGWDGSYNGKLSQEGQYQWAIEFKARDTDQRTLVHGKLNLLR